MPDENEIVREKLKGIKDRFGPEAEEFVRTGIVPLYSISRGSDDELWRVTHRAYKKGGIIVYAPELDLRASRGKVLLRHINYPDYPDPNAAFGFVKKNQSVVFADAPTSLNLWDGQVTDITTAILDLARVFHYRNYFGMDEGTYWRSNNAPNLVQALRVADDLSRHIREQENSKPRGFFPWTKK